MSVLKALILPPGCILVCILVGLIIQPRARRAGRVLVGVGLTAFYAASTPLLAGYAAVELESFGGGSSSARALEPQAIVVIAGDVRKGTPPTLGALTLDRVVHGARQARQTGLPLLVSGGPVRPVDVPSAQIMARLLRSDFQLEPRWIEDQSGSTWENAVNSAALLKKADVQRIRLVTQAWHMPRAAWSFRAQELSVDPAATSEPGSFEPGWRALLPSASALLKSYFVSHELLGLLWYRVRYL